MQNTYTITKDSRIKRVLFIFSGVDLNLESLCFAEKKIKVYAYENRKINFL